MEHKFLTISNASKSQTDIDIDGNIGPYWDWDEWKAVLDNTYKGLKKKLKDVPQTASHTINVGIASLGGSLDDGLKMHDLLANHKATKITDIKGYCASASTIIAQSASKGKRRMSANAFYLIHQASGYLSWANATEAESALEDLKRANQTIAELYARRSGKDVQVFIDLMAKNNGNGVWLTAQEAKEYGLVDEVYEPNEKTISNVNSLAGLMNNARNLPPLPQITNNSPDMDLKEFFEKLSNKIDNIGKKTPENNKGEGAETVEVKILDNEEVQTMMDNFKTQIENAVSKEDYEAIVTAKNALENEKQGWETEKQNWATEKGDMQNTIDQLQAKVDKAEGKPTNLDNGGDPDPQGGGATKTKNELAAEQNAAALKSN